MTEPVIDRENFESKYPSALGRPLSPARQAGFNALFDAWDDLPQLDHLDWLAYAMATAWHETRGTMEPVREGFGKTDAEAYARVTLYCERHGIDNYARRHVNGQSYYGRGFVQLTHAYNYEKVGKRLGLGLALYQQPDDVMQPVTASRILLLGLMEGLFRPKAGTIIDYFSAGNRHWFDARDMINGDKGKVASWTLRKWPGGKPTGELVAGYGRAFRLALATT